MGVKEGGFSMHSQLKKMSGSPSFYPFVSRAESKPAYS